MYEMYIEVQAEARRVKIDVVIVNWNSGDQLRQCLESLVRHGHACIEKIVVIDNDSKDRSEEVALRMKGVHLVRAAHNLGFAKACNLGVAQCGTDYILLLNPDARIFAGSLSVPLDFLCRPDSERIGIVGIQNIGQDGSIQRTCARFPSPKTFVVQSLGLNILWPRYFPDHFMREWAHDEDRQVDHVIGSYFLVRRKLWDQLSGMDERFFVYLEDLDFSLRANRLGWMTWYLAGAKVYHKGGGTSEQIKSTRLFYSLRSRLLYAAKHFGSVEFSIVLLATLFLEPIARLVKAAAQREWTAIDDTLHGYKALYRAAPNIIRRARAGG